jgi:predicted DNA-binding transcriptional regulator YafY
MEGAFPLPFNMNKITKIIILISLLYHRRSVNLKTIMEMCKISERTTYRYLNAISAANIPVYYDRSKGGYCLNQNVELDFNRCGIDEIVLLIIALKLLSEKLDGHYCNIIDKLIYKIISKQNFEFEEIVHAFGTRIKNDTGSIELSELITSIILQVAVASGKKVRIMLSNGDSEAELLIEEPSLQFNQEWRLSEKISGSDVGIPVSEILYALVKE